MPTVLIGISGGVGLLLLCFGMVPVLFALLLAVVVSLWIEVFHDHHRSGSSGPQ